jgi:hypothetical protein
MSTLFLIICGVAVVFYVVFLIECSRPRHAAKRVSVTGRQHGCPDRWCRALRRTLRKDENRLNMALMVMF